MLDSKLKAIDAEEKAEDRKYKLLNKGSLANNLNDLKNEKKALEAKLELYKNDAEKRKEIELSLAENKKKIDDLVYEAKIKGLNDSLTAFINFVGQESAIGKAAAIAQTTINTYEGASRALKDYIAPYSFIIAGLTIANGLATVAKIEGVQLFAEGTTNAPFGKHIVDEEGAELIFSKSGQLITTGSDKGAHFHDFKGGETVVPADVSAIIRQTMYKSYGMNDKQIMDLDYDKLGQSVGKYMNKHTNSIVKAINEKPTMNPIYITRNMAEKATHKGKQV